MSQYGYTLNVHGGDHRAMQDAFRLYAEKCEAEVAAGNSYPFASNLLTMQNLLQETTELDSEACHEFCEAMSRMGPRRRPT